MKTVAIVLAAGRSSRMGVNKLLLTVGEWNVLEHILRQLEPIPALVVTGFEGCKVKRLAESNGAQVIHNPEFMKGMTTSLQAGIRILDTDVEAVFMVLGDTFGFKHELLDRMINTMQGDPQSLIVSPVYQGRRGHPVLIGRALIEDFMNLEPGQTLKTVIDNNEEHHLYVEGDIWTVTDLDTPEDYEKVRRLWLVNRA